ncbi:MAG: 50S ribosomal protein L21 [Actinomycetota bacterium]|nr:50S ribosomal protein L21 [Actinomycetota bacterium]
MAYAIIALGGKQYRVREGERLLVDRLPYDEGKTFQADILLLGGDGDARVGGDLKGEQVTARIAAHVLGEKVIVGKHKRRTGYRRRNGYRSRLSQIEIQSIAKKAARSSTTKKTETAKKAEPAAKSGSGAATAKKTAKKAEEKK